MNPGLFAQFEVIDLSEGRLIRTYLFPVERSGQMVWLGTFEQRTSIVWIQSLVILGADNFEMQFIFVYLWTNFDVWLGCGWLGYFETISG